MTLGAIPAPFDSVEHLFYKIGAFILIVYAGTTTRLLNSYTYSPNSTAISAFFG
jgi:hypothetical protein